MHVLAGVTRWFVALLIIALMSAGATVAGSSAAQDEDTGDCVREAGDTELVVDAGEVTYRRSDVLGQTACDDLVSPEGSRLLTEYDTIEVGENGRARLLRDAIPEIVIFGNSTLTVAPDLEEDGRAYPQVHLGRGVMTVGDTADDAEPAPTATPGSDADRRTDLVAVTGAATLASVEASFFVYAGPAGDTWLVVSRGTVEVTSEKLTVPVLAGWQTVIVPDEPPQPPLPATRSIVDIDYQGDLPHIPQLTSDHLGDEDVFATCSVASREGTDLREGPGPAEQAVGHIESGSDLSVSHRASDAAWVMGTVKGGASGWVDVANLACPYDAAQLPVFDETVADSVDNCDGVANPDQAGSDPDGTGDGCDAQPPPETADSDGDGLVNSNDNCRDIFNPDQLDSDRDGSGDACDVLISDSDGDGVPNEVDNCVNNVNPDQADRDNDEVGDRCDGQLAGGEPDQYIGNLEDGDGVRDVWDNCPLQNNSDQLDADLDGIGDACEGLPPSDVDGDQSVDVWDNCPAAYNWDQSDSDGDGLGDVCDASFFDTDLDSFLNDADNCVDVFNPEQFDVDQDGIGDLCDSQPPPGATVPIDSDGDAVGDDLDNCTYDVNPDQADSDLDGAGDACDDQLEPTPLADSDGDAVGDDLDNCTYDYNPGQEDSDFDGLGDPCDFESVDSDGDTVTDDVDNCTYTYNWDQSDRDLDGIGDACDPEATPPA
jgi:hypothetical protein